MYEYNTVNVEILNSIAVVKFNRPKALNALSTEMTKELSDLFDKLEVNDSVRGIILRFAAIGELLLKMLFLQLRK